MMTSFTLFLYLTNLRKSPAHLIDHWLELKIGGIFSKYERVLIIRGNMSDLHFSDKDGKELTIPDLNQRLLNHQRTPIEFGTAFVGFLIFLGDLKFYQAKIRKYKLTSIDVFGHKHRIVVRPERFWDLGYIQDVFGVKGLV